MEDLPCSAVSTGIVHVGRAADVDVVVAGDPRPHLPFEVAIDPDGEHDETSGLILYEGPTQVWAYRHGDPVKEWGPHVDVVVALVRGWKQCGEGDLLVVVGGEDAEAVVVDANSVVGVVGADGDLEGGGEGVGGGGVELVDRRVLEGEAGLGWAEDCPDYEDHEEHQYYEGEDSGKESLVQLLPPMGVLPAVPFSRHD